MNVLVYHGSIMEISEPLCGVGRSNLDFGKGFYVTFLKSQAIEWAKKIAEREGKIPIVNVYSLDKDSYMQEGRSLVFEKYDIGWLNFIANCRQGKSNEYDYIEGGIADDRVIDTVQLYMAGLMDARTALGRLIMHKPNIQICLRSQVLLNKYLRFYGAEKV